MEQLQLGRYANEKHLYKSPSSFGIIYASICLCLYFYIALVPSLPAPWGHIRPGSCYMLQFIHKEMENCGYFAQKQANGRILAATTLWPLISRQNLSHRYKSCPPLSSHESASRSKFTFTGFSLFLCLLLCQKGTHDLLRPAQRRKINTANSEHRAKALKSSNSSFV